jgi:hypothetical protein
VPVNVLIVELRWEFVVSPLAYGDTTFAAESSVGLAAWKLFRYCPADGPLRVEHSLRDAYTGFARPSRWFLGDGVKMRRSFRMTGSRLSCRIVEEDW